MHTDDHIWQMLSIQISLVHCVLMAAVLGSRMELPISWRIYWYKSPRHETMTNDELLNDNNAIFRCYLVISPPSASEIFPVHPLSLITWGVVSMETHINVILDMKWNIDVNKPNAIKTEIDLRNGIRWLIGSVPSAEYGMHEIAII